MNAVLHTQSTNTNSAFTNAITQVTNSIVDAPIAPNATLETVFLNIGGSNQYAYELHHMRNVNPLDELSEFNNATPEMLKKMNAALARQILVTWDNWKEPAGDESHAFPQHIDEDGGLNENAQTLLKNAGLLNNELEMTDAAFDAILMHEIEHAPGPARTG